MKPDDNEGLIFACDEAACREDIMFYEVFSMDDRWDIIRAVLKAARKYEATPDRPHGLARDVVYRDETGRDAYWPVNPDGIDTT